MAALVVTLSPRHPGASGARLDVFPGSSTPAIYPAGAPFWIGYGFARDPGAFGNESASGSGAIGAPGLGDETRFELDVDGRRVRIASDVESMGADPILKTDLASFPEGLPAGWHAFSGRWYDGGKLVLSSHTAVQFVER